MKLKEENKLIRVALYIRVSTDRQAKEGDSLEAQEEALTTYAKKQNYLIVDTYIDGGESGQKIKRTNLQRLLKDVERGTIDLVIMTKLDRWFRNVADFYKVIEILKRNKVNWKTIWEDYDTTTASGEFWLNMSLALGQMEAKRTGERIKEIFDHKFKSQKTVCSGNRKYGYNISIEKRYVINDEEAQNIKELYNYFIDSENLLETVKWFRETKKNVSYASIKNYLKDISYTGHYLRKSTNEIIEDFIPAIIDKETFEKAQTIFQRNIKNYSHYGNFKNEYIFVGLLRCPECGSRLSGTSNKSGNKYYRCKKYATGSCTKKTLINEKKLEDYLIMNIVHIEQTKITELEITAKDSIKNQDKIKQMKNKMNKLTDLYINDLINGDYYKQEYEKLKRLLEVEENKGNRKSIANQKINEIKKILDDFLPNVYKNLSSNEKRLLWGKLFNHLIVDFKDNEFIIEIEID